MVFIFLFWFSSDLLSPMTPSATPTIMRKRNFHQSKKSFEVEKGVKHQVLAIKTGVKWYNLKSKLDNVPKSKNSLDLSRDQITQLRVESLSLIKADLSAYEEYKKSNVKRDDFEWIGTVLSNGTVNDKLAAHTVLIQDSAVHNLKSIDNLLRFVNTKGKRECSMAIDNLRDLFVGDLLIPKKKLKTFEELINGVETNFLFHEQSALRTQFLIISYVEDQIRSYYKRFLDQLVTISHDTLESLKLKAIRTLSDLFINNPELEKFLLSSLVNKLGDPTPKVASQCARLLSQIIAKHHPQMKMVIVKEVERLLFRQHLTERTQYYCLCFLSEILFQPTVDQQLANHLIEIYFSLFNKCVKLGDVNNKTMSVLLTGVSRAFPYSKLETSFLEKYLQTFYKLIHFVNINTGIQSLSLIFNLVNFNESGSLTDRFYSVMYRFLFQPNLDQCSKVNLFLNILYRAIKKDSVHKRVRAFFKRILQVALQTSSPFVISALILISEAIKSKDGFQLSINSMLKEDEQIAKGDYVFNEDDDEIEKYDDVAVGEEISEKTNDLSNSAACSWVFVESHQNKKPMNENAGSTNYLFDARNPLFCNAEFEELWELSLLTEHYHPTVKLFVDNIVSGVPIEYDGDPLQDFTIKHFLDRFAFRNPKSTVSSKKKPDNFNRHNLFGRLRINSFAKLSSRKYLELPESEIPPDERFIYRYLKQKKSLRAENVDIDDDSDIESVDSLEFNDILDNYENYANDEENFIGDIDFVKSIKDNTVKRKKPSSNEEMDDLNSDDADFDEEDSDMDFDDNDVIDDEEFLDENFDYDDDDDDDVDKDDIELKVKKPRNAAPFAGKKGFTNITNDLFASAEEFSHILEQNDSDSDFDLDQESTSSGKQKQTQKPGHKKPKRPTLGRNQKRKKNKRKLIAKHLE